LRGDLGQAGGGHRQDGLSRRAEIQVHLAGGITADGSDIRIHLFS
jgi:hypothetical protein